MSFQVYNRPCNTCIFNKNSPVSDERFEELQDIWKTSDTTQICHKATLKGEQIGCKGHYDAASRGEIPSPLKTIRVELGFTEEMGISFTDFLQIAIRVGWITLVDLEE